MYITFKYKNRIRIMELEEFKKQDFYNEKNFGKVCIYDFAYLSSKRELTDYRQKIMSTSIKKLKFLNV